MAKHHQSDTIMLSHARSKSMAVSMMPDDSNQPGSIQQWLKLMRTFHESRRVFCKPETVEKNENRKLITGSTYSGFENQLGMQGFGTYTFQTKDRVVTYEGFFDNGEFHGEGKLTYDCGAVITCRFDRGRLLEKSLIFPDGLVHFDVEDWLYCKYPDRRYKVEYDNGVEPAGRSYITSEMPPREIPPGYYDVGYGLFEPETKNVFKYDDLTSIVKYLSEDEKQWIIKNCRTHPVKQVGPCRFFYEKWLKPVAQLEDPPPPSAYPVDSDLSLFDDDDDDDRQRRRIRFSRAASRLSRLSLGIGFF